MDEDRSPSPVRPPIADESEFRSEKIHLSSFSLYMALADSLIKTLVFFDIFDRPLTAFEAYKWLWGEKTSLEEVQKNLLSNPRVEAKNGFFFLSGRQKIVDDGVKRQVWSDKKMARARRAARLLGIVPFVRLAAVCNTLSFGAADEKSDIDFFIIAKSGRIWLVRFCSALLLSFFGLRRHGWQIKNKICLSFFITDDNLNLESIALSGAPDIYLVYWLAQLVPLVNRGNTLEKFWQANSWIKKYLPNFSFENQLPDEREVKICPLFGACRRFCEFLMSGFLGNLKENFLRFVQLKKMSKNLKSRQFEGGTAVIINDKILKFHEEDRREYYRKKWDGKVRELGIMDVPDS